MNITQEMIANQVEHKYAGNGWAVVAEYPQEWASVVYVGKGEVGRQFFSAWKPLLKTEKQSKKGKDGRWVKTNLDQPLHPKILAEVNSIRQDLASGKKIIKDTRLVPV